MMMTLTRYLCLLLLNVRGWGGGGGGDTKNPVAGTEIFLAQKEAWTLGYSILGRSWLSSWM